MALKPGMQLGSYEITAPLGAGGMGEVYRATDTKLKREVAIKVLPDDVAGDRERLARFAREAHVLASLNHPHIASIYGLEESGGAPCLVLELVEGQTLAEMLASGPLPIEKALGMVRQIAEALEAAHEKGVIHRDLKPANVKITPEGSVKVLDFGLAKVFAVESVEVSSDLSLSPTVTISPTRAGVILGTAPYMSPEQARGEPVDKRTDIWAFGCVLYEMLTGRQAFLGETASAIMARILERSPQWDALPERTPLKVRELLKRCLTKDGRDRLHDIADARIEIEEVLADPVPQFTVSTEQPGPGKTLTRWLPWLVAAVALVALALNLLRDAPVERTEPMRASLVLPAELQFRITDGHALALSPDGSRLVVAAHDERGSRLYLRDLAGDIFVPLPGTEGAKNPFFSPDGEWVAFTDDDDSTLKKTALAGGNPVAICDKVDPGGGSWGPDGSIIFARTWGGGLWRVPAAGGQPAPLAPVDAPGEYRVHLWPQVLPGGSGVLYTDGYLDESKLMVVSPETGEHRVVVHEAMYGRYATSGHLLYIRDATLFAQRFDSRRLELSGPPVPVLDDVGRTADTGLAHFTFAGNGTLVFLPQLLVNPPQQLLWVERDGSERSALGEFGTYIEPTLSPDGGRIALCSGEQLKEDVWIHDLVRDNRTRLTLETTLECGPIWTPDGQHVVYYRTDPGQYNLFWTPADGSRPGELLYDGGLLDSVPTSISPDGVTLLFHTFGDQDTDMDIWQISLKGEKKPSPLVRTKFTEWGAAFSRDGDWIAFVSNESGTHEVYVQAFPDSRGKIRVSSDGGMSPVWSKDGAELFYRSGDRMMTVEVETGQTFTAGKPRLLFRGRYHNPMWYRDYDVASDGRFLMVKTPEEHAARQINVIFNWFEELERLAPTN